MKTHQTCLAAFLLVAAASVVNARQPEVIGYYPSWKWSSRDNLVSPSRIPYAKFTIINYAFFVPSPDGTISGKDSVGDALYLRSGRGTTIVDRAHHHGVKVVLSLGGWEDSGNFPVVASNGALRSAFAHSCCDAIREFGFDGIDVDWEFPGLAEHNGTSADRDNFTKLLRVLKDSLVALGNRDARTYLLTAALPAGGSHLKNMDVSAIAGILDMLNIMTYDFYGSWDSLANHNCPLYPSRGADPSRCVDAAFTLYHATLGIPASRVNLGVPFYGHTFTDCDGLNARHHGADTVHFSRFGAFYYDIVRQLGDFTRMWDEDAKVPYLVSTARHEVISYDDTASVRAKARYVRDHHAGGLIIWEITGDFLDDGSTPLLDVITDEFATLNTSGH